MRRFGFVAVLVGVVTASSFAEDAVPIKVAGSAAGDRIKTTITEKKRWVYSTAEQDVITPRQNSDVSLSIVYVDEIITPGEKGGLPLKMKRTYEKYEGAGKWAEAALKAPILIEKKGGRYEFTVEGKESILSKQLSVEFDGDMGVPRLVKLLPEKGLKVGDTWKIDPAALKGTTNAWGDPKVMIQDELSQVTGKLVKTYQKDGKQFGELEIKGEMHVKTGPNNRGGAKISVTVEVCLNGTSATMSGTLVTHDTTSENERGTRSDTNITITRVVELLPKK